MKNFFYSMVTILLIFAFFEGVARIFYRPDEYHKRINAEAKVTDNDFYIKHKTLGWIHKPGYTGCPENFAKINKPECFTINSQGLRDREYTFKKADNVTRIICIGDSITQGSGASNEDAYPKALERLLNNKYASPYHSFEVLNGGVGDYNTFQEELFLEEIGLKYHPDIVILQWYPNDGRKYVPSKKPFLEEGLDKMYSKSAAIYFLDRGVRRILIAIMKAQWEKGRARWQPQYNENKWMTDKSEVDSLIDMADKDWGAGWRKVGWEQSKDSLEKLIELSKKRKFKLIIVYFPVKLQIIGAGADKHDLFLPEKNLKEFCAKNDIYFISLLTYLKQNYSDNLFLDICHYTAGGADVVADFLAKNLSESGFLKN